LVIGDENGVVRTSVLVMKKARGRAIALIGRAKTSARKKRGRFHFGVSRAV